MYAVESNIGTCPQFDTVNAVNIYWSGHCQVNTIQQYIGRSIAQHANAGGHQDVRGMCDWIARSKI